MGKGGEGTVYQVKHYATGQIRAAKRFAETAGVSRGRELRVLRTLQHEALPGMIDVLEEGTQCWLIMEYIDGLSLERCRQKEPSEAFFFACIMQLLAVVSYLHSREPPVLHLDIKPSNLMLSRDGRLYLIDFGAACMLRLNERQNPCVGTPGFSAPEQMDPQQCVDKRTDVYGCGAVMYWLLFGECPNEQRLKLGAVKGLHEKEWKREIRRIVQQCMDAEKEKRPENVEVLRQAVARVKKRCARRRWNRIILKSAAVLCLVCLLLGQFAKREQQEQSKVRLQAYWEELERAEDFGIELASECYQTAILLCPEEFSWSIHLADRICEDYCFSLEEENVLRNLLYMALPKEEETVLERMKADSACFAEFSYRIGLAYWYYYEGSDGKRAAVSWFEAAENCESDEWREAAALYKKVGSYYGKIGHANQSGEQETEYGMYWEDICQLWQMDGFPEKSEQMRRQVAEELLGGILFHSGELKKYGISEGKVRNTLEDISMFFAEADIEDEAAQCLAAEQAVERAYGYKKEKESGD